MTTTTNQDPFIHLRAIPRRAPTVPRTPPVQPPSVEKPPTASVSVSVTYALFDLIAGLGWVYLTVIGLGLVIAWIGLATVNPVLAIPVALIGGFILALPGFLMIAFSQVSRSIVDTAEHTRRLVDLLDSRLPK